MTGTDQTVLAVDVGGTSFKGAIVDAAGRLRLGKTTSILGLSGEAAYERLAALCAGLVERARAHNLAPNAVGIIAPGVDEASGKVQFSSNLGWRDLPVRDRLGAALELPVAAGHDVRTAGIAEGILGAGRGRSDFTLVMIGTGIAAAFMCNGAIVAGARNMGGEFGHMPVIPDGDPCPCGQRGCLEAYASGSGMARRYQALGGTAALTAGDIAVAQNRDPLAARVWGEAVRALALGMATVTVLLDPGGFVLGGGLAEAGLVLLDPLRAQLSSRLAWRSPPPIETSPLALAAGRIGASILAFRLTHEDAIFASWDREAILASYRGAAGDIA